MWWLVLGLVLGIGGTYCVIAYLLPWWDTQKQKKAKGQ